MQKLRRFGSPLKWGLQNDCYKLSSPLRTIMEGSGIIGPTDLRTAIGNSSVYKLSRKAVSSFLHLFGVIYSVITACIALSSFSQWQQQGVLTISLLHFLSFSV